MDLLALARHADRGDRRTQPGTRGVKIDVEGHELPALRGAAGIIQKWRPNLLVEIEEARSPAVPTIEYLYDFGYKGLMLVGGRWIPLAESDLVGHQKAMSAHAGHGYLRAVIDGSGAKFVNNILFRYARGRFDTAETGMTTRRHHQQTGHDCRNPANRGCEPVLPCLTGVLPFRDPMHKPRLG
ncbi:FkbM family methyltransferase [Frankia gtarii]|uniref:FkbM family methyltransferase n=1 Tax=Frankia gtarii TaxID=2950102 RepID=UPI0021BE9152|nr:FkbM family methyltransferase [Frankia gtarii]